MHRVVVLDGWDVRHRGKALRPGQVIKLDAATARRFIESGVMKIARWWQR